jgi:chorismate mutase
MMIETKDVGLLIAAREKIDEIDSSLLKLLEERIQIVSEIGAWKKEQGVPVQDKNREAELLDKLKSKSDIPDELIEKVWGAVIAQSRETQESIKEQ